MAEIQHICQLCAVQFRYEYSGGRKRAYCPNCTEVVRRRKNPFAVKCDRCGCLTLPRGPSQGKAKTCKGCRERHAVAACEGCGASGEKTVKGLCANCRANSIKIMNRARKRLYKGRSTGLVPYFARAHDAIHLECAECRASFTYQTDSGRVRGFPRKFCGRACQKRASDRVKSKARRAATRGFGAVEKVDPTLVFVRDNWKCQICGMKTLQSKRGQPHPKAPELDHIMPLSLGGDHSYQNTQCTCRDCNSRKGAKPYGQLMLFPSA